MGGGVGRWAYRGESWDGLVVLALPACPLPHLEPLVAAAGAAIAAGAAGQRLAVVHGAEQVADRLVVDLHHLHRQPVAPSCVPKEREEGIRFLLYWTGLREGRALVDGAGCLVRVAYLKVHPCCARAWMEVKIRPHVLYILSYIYIYMYI